MPEEGGAGDGDKVKAEVERERQQFVEQLSSNAEQETTV